MKEINIGGKQIRVRATPLALLRYKQEFQTDLVGDMLKMNDIEKEPSRIDSVVLMQIIWAMAKADAGLGNTFPSFEKWLSGMNYFDMSDSGLWQAIMEEAADGFFRRGTQQQKPKEK